MHEVTVSQKKARSDLALLARAGETFAAASGYEEMLHRLMELVLPVLGDLAFVEVLEGESVRSLAAAHQDPELDRLLKSVAWSRPTHEDWSLSALRGGRTIRVEGIEDDWLREVAPPEYLSVVRQLELTSLISVPMRSGEQVVGAVTVCFAKSRRRHTEHDHKLLEDLARRGAMSIAQAQLFARAQEAARSAEEANRLKDDFLATVSHELRTPLNAILGWSALLRKRAQDPALGKPAEIIHRNALAQGKIIEDILDASRIINGNLRLELETADLAGLVREAIELLRPSIASKSLDVQFVACSERCPLIADSDRLQQVVWNVLSNAVKFSNPGGGVRISLDRDGPSWSLVVQDDGRGIAPEFLPFVFDRFKQADGSTTRRVGGLGLGLAIVRQLVELHGGSVEATSPGVDRGATFRITLPAQSVVGTATGVATNEAPTEEPPLSVEAGQALAGVSVLVVDDEEDARELLRAALEHAGAAVHCAASAEQGVAALHVHRPQVLVSDIGMPDEDGYSFVRRVRALPPAAAETLIAIALTAYTRDVDRDRALAAGFDAHMSKPVETDALTELIAQLLRGTPPGH